MEKLSPPSPYEKIYHHFLKKYEFVNPPLCLTEEVTLISGCSLLIRREGILLAFTLGLQPAVNAIIAFICSNWTC